MSDKIKVGDKVRVVRGFEYDNLPNLVLREGQIYTVTSVEEQGHHGDSDYGINVDNGDGGYGSWDADRFELVTEEKGSPEREVPVGVQEAHDEASELFTILAQAGAMAFIEGKQGHLTFVKSLAERLDAVLVALENEYPTLDKEIS